MIPPIQDLEASSDCRFRDMVSRNQHQVATAGNVMQKSYHHIDGGNVASLSAMQVVRTDNNLPQVDFFLRTSAAPLANVATSDSIFSLSRSNTTIRSATTEVGNLIATNITGNLFVTGEAPGTPVNLDNVLIRSFQRNLSSPAGSASSICTLSNNNGGYSVELDVVQSEGAVSIAKKYQFAVRSNATNGLWRRLVPLSSSHLSNSDWCVEARVEVFTLSGTFTTLRLVRLSGNATADIECTITVYQPREDTVSVQSSTTTTTNVTVSNTLYEATHLTQARGLVGIGTETLNTALTVSGRLSAQSATASSILAGTRIGALGRILDATVINQGAYMSCNHFGDQSVDFICKKGTGTGGFHFFNSNTSGTPFSDGKVSLARITQSGGVTLLTQGAVFSAPGSILGSVFATGRFTGMTEGITISPTSLTPNANWITVATYNYAPKSSSSRLSVFVDIAYLIGGSGNDKAKARLTVDNAEVSLKEQWFGISAGTTGSGTRSTTIFPITAIVNNTSVTSKTIRVQLLQNETDDTLTLNSTNWVFKLLERKT